MLFGKCGPTAKELGVLVTRPLTNFRKATEKLGEHFHCLKGKKYHFRVQAGDEVLKQHLRTAAGNALYTSKTVQNEMITVCGDLI